MLLLEIIVLVEVGLGHFLLLLFLIRGSVAGGVLEAIGDSNPGVDSKDSLDEVIDEDTRGGCEVSKLELTDMQVLGVGLGLTLSLIVFLARDRSCFCAIAHLSQQTWLGHRDTWPHPGHSILLLDLLLAFSSGDPDSWKPSLLVTGKDLHELLLLLERSVEDKGRKFSSSVICETWPDEGDSL